MFGVWSIVSPDSDKLGATFVAALARSLSFHGKRVLVFDLSPRFPVLDVAFGVSERVVYTLPDVARVSPELAVLSVSQEKQGEGGILFVPVAVGDEVSLSSVSSVMEAVAADIVLLHAERETASLARAVSDGLLLLTQADAPSLRANACLAHSLTFDAFVLADFLPIAEEIEKEPSVTEMADALCLPLFGILPRTELKNTARPRGKDFLSAVDNMAARLTGEDVPLLRGIPIEGMRRRTFFTR